MLKAVTGHEVQSLRGMRQVFALRPNLSLGMGSDWCRLLDRSLDPLGSQIAVSTAQIVSAATDGEYLAVTEVGGPLRIFDLDGRERARVADHFRHVVHDPVTATWVVVWVSDDEQTSLLRLTHDAEVLEQRPWDPFRDVATMRGGKVLVLLTDEGPHVLDCSDGSARALEAT